MRSQPPPDRGPEANRPAWGWARRLRALPGFKAAVVAFLVTVILGGGTIAAVANWQQSSTATIAITAGAAMPTPPPLYGNVVTPAVFVTRPATLVDVTCTSPKDPPNIDFTVTWPAAENASAYAVTLFHAGSSDSIASHSVTTNTAIFTFGEPGPADGDYVLRIQPFAGANAGDAVYRNVTFAQKKFSPCPTAGTTSGPSPLGAVSPTAQPVVRGAATSTMAIKWTPSAGAASYVVTVKSSTSGYGTEFTTSDLTATLTFPQAARDAAGNLINPADASAPYYGDYTFRIQPMNGTTAGDPVYMTIKYYSSSSSME